MPRVVRGAASLRRLQKACVDSRETRARAARFVRRPPPPAQNPPVFSRAVRGAHRRSGSRLSSV